MIAYDGEIGRPHGVSSKDVPMRWLAWLFIVGYAGAAPTVGLDREAKTAYQLRVVVRYGDHPTLTKTFRHELRKEVLTALQTGLGANGSVEVVDLADLAPEQRDPITKLVAEKGLESLDTVNGVSAGKTHYITVDFADSKYELRGRQYDGTCGFVTPIIRKNAHADRTFIPRLVGLMIAQDFGVVGTLEPTGEPQVSLPLKAGEITPLEGWVKKGDIFAVVQIRESKRVARPVKGKDGKPLPPAPALYGTRLEGVLLQVVDRPPTGTMVCRIYNRYQGALPRDANTVGYRCVKLGTAEAPLKLQLVNPSGSPFKADELQVRAGVTDYPAKDRDGSEFTFSEGLYSSKDAFAQMAFVLVKAGEAPVARIPVEVYADTVLVRKVALNPKNAGRSYFMEIAGDLLDRIRSSRVVQAGSFDEVGNLQKLDKTKALEFAQKAFDSQRQDIEALQLELVRLKQRFSMEAPEGSFDACTAELRALDQRTQELRTHVQNLKEVIRLENDPMAVAQRKNIEGLMLDAKLLVGKGDYDPAIAKYEEALKLAENDVGAKAGLQQLLATLRKEWELKDAEHGIARKFIYESWVKLEKAPEVRERLAEAKQAYEKCKAVGDMVALRKMYLTAPQVLERYSEHLKMLTESAVEDEDKQALQGYLKITDDLQQLVADVGKAIGANAPAEKK